MVKQAKDVEICGFWHVPKPASLYSPNIINKIVLWQLSFDNFDAHFESIKPAKRIKHIHKARRFDGNSAEDYEELRKVLKKKHFWRNEIK